MDGAEPPFDRILEKASNVVRRCKETTGNVEPAEGYKRRQIQKLKQFASNENLWIQLNPEFFTFLDKGRENEVFFDNHASVIKLNNFDYAGDDLTNFFIRIFAHNYFFNNIPYTLLGFAYNSMNEFCAVLIQPFKLEEKPIRKRSLRI